jgi:hypothetical protein
MPPGRSLQLQFFGDAPERKFLKSLAQAGLVTDKEPMPAKGKKTALLLPSIAPIGRIARLA